MTRPVALAAVLAALLVAALPAAAGGPIVRDAPAGPYRLTATADPDPPRVGPVTITTAVDLAGSPALDAVVTVEARHADGGEPVRATASRDRATIKLFQAARLSLDRPGRWRIVVAVAGPAGSGEAVGDLDVLPAEPFGWLGPALLFALPSVTVVALFVLRRRARRAG